MFLVRGILWMCCLLWISLTLDMRGGEEVAPSFIWVPAVATACYLVCLVQRIGWPGHTVWKESIALGVTLFLPFLVPGAILIMVGMVGGIQAWFRKTRSAVRSTP